MLFERKLLKNLDWTFIGLILLIIAVSLFVLKSASANIVAGNPYYHVKKQAVWFLLGLGVIGVVASFNYANLQRLSLFIYLSNIAVLVAVLAIGTSSKGAQRWLAIGPMEVQPSEIAKIAIIISFASFLAKRQGRLNTLWDLLPCVAYIGVPMALILKQPDLGTSLVFLAIMMGMLWVAGINPKLMAVIIIVLFIGAGIIFGVLYDATGGFQYPPEENVGFLPLKPYQLMRLIIFINPQMDPLGKGYHIIQSQVAIGSGGLWGKGIEKGSQVQGDFLPEHHTDFIFSVIGEELGYVGSISILFLYFLFLARGVKIALEARDIFGTLIVIGIVSMFTFHLMVNVGMTIGVMPVTGLPLPFFTYGGSSTLTNMLALGLMISINLRRQKLMF